MTVRLDALSKQINSCMADLSTFESGIPNMATKDQLQEEMLQFHASLERKVEQADMSVLLERHKQSLQVTVLATPVSEQCLMLGDGTSVMMEAVLDSHLCADMYMHAITETA